MWLVLWLGLGLRIGLGLRLGLELVFRVINVRVSVGGHYDDALINAIKLRNPNRSLSAPYPAYI